MLSNVKVKAQQVLKLLKNHLKDDSQIDVENYSNFFFKQLKTYIFSTIKKK